MTRKMVRETIATTIPAAVVIKASPIPAAALVVSAEVPPPPIFKLAKVAISPVTVPNRPNRGAIPTTDSRVCRLFASEQILDRQPLPGLAETSQEWVA